MRTTKKVIPVAELGWEEKETSLVTPTAKAPKASSSKPVPPRAPRVNSPPPPKPAPGPRSPKPLAVTPHRPFAIVAPLPRLRPALPTQLSGAMATRTPLRAPPPKPVFEPARFSTMPPSNGATMPAPPPSMTGAIFVDERMFDSLDPVDLADIASATGTIDVQEAWLEDLIEQDIEPESYWFRPRMMRG
jgi:hypothetical protein